MIVTNTPAVDLALTNLAYCSHADLHGFAVPGTKLFLASIGDAFVLSVSYPFRNSYPFSHFVRVIENCFISLRNHELTHKFVSYVLI
jgi:hypothetical protein